MIEINEYFKRKIKSVIALCMDLKVEELYFFGSSINGEFIYGKSDLDIYVKIKKENVKNLVRLSKELRKLYNCRIDVFCSIWQTDQKLLDHIIRNNVLVYKKK